LQDNISLIGIAELGPDGRIRRTNRQFARLVGWRREELSGVMVADVLCPLDAALRLDGPEDRLGTRPTPKRWKGTSDCKMEQFCRQGLR
jgi:PAS domain S-box-containing protein